MGSSKAKLREKLKAQRSNLSLADVKRLSSRIVKHVLRTVDWQKVKNLHVYLPIKEQNEVDTWPLIARLAHERPYITIAVPRLKSGQMEAVVPDSHTKMKPSRFGITEPVGGRVLPKSFKFDVIIVPMIGFDEHGHRLGYGGGYYDRFLKTQPQAQTIGLCYDLGFIKKSPHEAGDAVLKQIITQSGAKLRTET